MARHGQPATLKRTRMEAWVPSLPHRLGTVLGYGLPTALLVLGVFFLSEAYGRSPTIRGDDCPFNSDDLYTVDIARQALAGYDLRGCHLPYAPYVFHDM